MQTFIVKICCLFLFGFIFISAYQTNGAKDNKLSSNATTQPASTILVSSEVEKVGKVIRSY